MSEIRGSDLTTGSPQPQGAQGATPGTAATPGRPGTPTTQRLSDPGGRGETRNADPAVVLQDPDKRNRLLAGIAAGVLLNLLLLLVLVASMLGDDAREEVVVDGVPCVVLEADGESSALFCRRN